MAEHAIQAHGDMEESHDFEIHEVGIHHPHSSKKQIWTVFFIMVVITVIEFLIALTPGIRSTEEVKGLLPHDVVVIIFLGLTVLKAFYIVGYFMHLKMEKVNMVYTVLLPVMFILYLIALLMIEGSGGTGIHHAY